MTIVLESCCLEWYQNKLFDLAFSPCFIAMLLKTNYHLKQSVIFITRLEFYHQRRAASIFEN